MIKLTGSSLWTVEPLFSTYASNIPVIYSVIEGQYEGAAYVDSESRWALLVTPFLQHFLAGEPLIAQEALAELLFDEVLHNQAEKELVVFSSTANWQPMLKSIFESRGGVSDDRYIFRFDKERYRSIVRPVAPDEAIVRIAGKPAPAPSPRPIQVAEVVVDGRPVSTCGAIMVGKNMAELDIETDEGYRGRGYATIAAFSLIDRLLEQGLTPCWTAWPFRKASHAVARKVGFAHAETRPHGSGWDRAD
jgi:RimJ/RimL family protein N-acetyltransferase